MSIVEVSKAAGVSIATVSRVLNNHPHVSAATAEAVKAAAKKIGYNPPRSRGVGRLRREADGTAAGTATGAVAVLFPDTDRASLRTPLSGRLLDGIERALQRHALSMVVTTLPESGGIPASIERNQVDGVIVRGTGGRADPGTLVGSLPAVWMFEADRRQPLPGDMVLEDNADVGTTAARWLLDRGHRRLAYLNLVPAHASFHVRWLFFRDEAERAGVPLLTLAQAAPAAESVERLLKGAKGDRPTGLFIPGSDPQVAAVYHALRARGVVVGRDLDLISCNNDAGHLAALDPALPNIDIRAEEIGRAAVDLLLWRLRHPAESHRRVVIPPALVDGSGPSRFKT